MKFLKCYAVVDIDAENVISNFFAVNDKMAKRIFDDAYKSVSDDIKERYKIFVFVRDNGACLVDDNPGFALVAETVGDIYDYYQEVKI